MTAIQSMQIEDIDIWKCAVCWLYKLIELVKENSIIYIDRYPCKDILT